jgi:lipopolysaccharide export LptBFGC system permease protein LptF
MHSRGMNTFHRHLLAGYLKNLSRAMAVLVLVVIGLDCSSSPTGPLQNWLGMLASAVNTALPLALLIATLFTVGDLARYQELTALGAAGWSTLRISWPMIGVAVLATVLSGALEVSDLCRSPGADRAVPFVQRSEVVGQTPATRTEAHAGRAYPLLNLFATLTAIPLASSRRRVTAFAHFSTALAILAAYYIVTATTLALGRQGSLSPLMAGWLGPTIFAAGIGLLWRRTKQ